MKSYVFSIETKTGVQLGYTKLKSKTKEEALVEFKRYLGHLAKCKLLDKNEVYRLYDEEDEIITEVKI